MTSSEPLKPLSLDPAGMREASPDGKAHWAHVEQLLDALPDGTVTVFAEPEAAVSCPECARAVELDTRGLIERHQSPGQHGLLAPACPASGVTMVDARRTVAVRLMVRQIWTARDRAQAVRQWGVSSGLRCEMHSEAYEELLASVVWRTPSAELFNVEIFGLPLTSVEEVGRRGWRVVDDAGNVHGSGVLIA